MEVEKKVVELDLNDVLPNRFQPRIKFNEDSINELAESIKEHGVIQRIVVRAMGDKYEIIAGERRYKASVLAGLTKIPAMVRQIDDKECSIIAFIENEHRSDVSAIEEAKTMDRILKSNNMTQEELAKELGINQSTIANKIRLLNLPLEVQDALMHNEISERHARSLLSVKNEEKQIELLNKIKEKRMTVRELDSEIKEMNNMNENMYDNNQMNNLNQTIDMNNYLNNAGVNPMPQAPTAAMPNIPTPSMPESAPADPGFMDFLNNYDNANPLPAEQPAVEPTVAPVPESAPADPGFMDFLNNYDNNNPLPAEPAVQTPEPAPVLPPEEPTAPSDDGGFMNFLNNYNNSTESAPAEEPASEFNEDIYSNFGAADNNVSIDDLTPPITPDFNNQYIEDNPNYVDISKQTMIDNVDDIINRLKVVVDDSKNNSKFKIDTDEINYDDIYQITIKIDKRDF